MRLRLRRLTIWRSVVAVSFASSVAALAIWFFRPVPFAGWLNAGGIGNNGTPISIIASWAGGRLAPMSFIGLMSAFPSYDLGVLFALLIVLAVIGLFISAVWRDPSTQSADLDMSSRIPLPRARLRLRTFLILIAFFGIALAWEVIEWRSWPLRMRYQSYAASSVLEEDRLIHLIQSIDESLTSVETQNDSLSPSAQAAQKACRQNELLRQRDFESGQLEACRQRRQKYERAANDPLAPLAPDPPIPFGEWRRPDALYRGEYALALAECDEQAQKYGELVRAFHDRALIRAACPDANLRDGERAVELATHAAELTLWKDKEILSTLAAAYAECGDFSSAIRWEERALGDVPDMNANQERIRLYRAGKPYRLPWPRK